jgi:hypothetical protein
VDPAGNGGDRFAIAFRRGDAIFRVDARNKLEHDEAVAWLSAIIDEWQPNRMCIDRGSMGQNIISSLRALNKRYFESSKASISAARRRPSSRTPSGLGRGISARKFTARLLDFLSKAARSPTMTISQLI